jgi:DNA-binding NarL/FixJ family response regulator
MHKNTILIVDDHVLFREGLCNIIIHWDDFEVVGEAENGEEAIQKTRDLLPDIILMDIGMPVMNGIQATRQIYRVYPTTRIVILTVSEEEENLMEAIKSGAKGYVLKNTPARRLHDQLRSVLRGEAALSGIMAEKILQEFNRPRGFTSSDEAVTIESLTDREQEVLQLVVEGLTNLEIGERLTISENTVKKYIHNILEKLHLNNRVEAAIYAVKEGLVKL